MDLIALDTCSPTSFAARVDGSTLRGCVVGAQPSSLLPGALLELWQAAPAPPRGLVISRGPGSFTGIKVGLAGAWGFARARALPLVGVDRLEALALAASRLPGLPGAAADRLFLASVSAWAGMVYGAVLGQGRSGLERKGSYMLGLPATLLDELPGSVILVEPADPTPWEKVPPDSGSFAARVRVPTDALALALAELGAARILGGAGGTGQVRPLFLRMTEEKSW